MASDGECKKRRSPSYGHGGSDDEIRRRANAGGASNLTSFVAGTTPRFDAPLPNLSDVWSYYDDPFGHEVPLVLDGVRSYAFYVPHLSALQVYGRPRGSRDEEKLLEYFETAKPNERVPLIDKVSELDEASDGVLKGAAELNRERSWYAISWFPILSDQYTARAVRGCFLTYHRFRDSSCPFAVDDGGGDGDGDCGLAGAGGTAGRADTAGVFGAAAAAAGPGYGESEVLPRAAACTCSFEGQRFLSVCGIVPYKVREPTWEGSSGCPVHAHPGLRQLRESAERIVSTVDAAHPDFVHFSGAFRR